jgi:1-acyl-sn-glycerol-3-phosphate acyltransferase
MPAVRDTIAYEVCLRLLQLSYVLLFRFRAWGVEHVPSRGGVLLAGNHQSFLDPPAAGLALGRQICFMARSGLFRIPGLGRLIPKLHAFPVERETADLRAIRQAVEILSEGNCLVLFPEGTRSPDGSVGVFKPGFALVAARARVPVVPVAVDGAFAAWPRGRRLPRCGRVRVAYGEPLMTESSQKSACLEFAAEVRRRVATLLEELRQRE